MEPVILKRSQARKIIIHAAGLARKAQFGDGIEAVYRVIDHLGFVQLDTNYVVERAHHHTLASRVPGYKKQWLAELCEDGRVYEYFTSDAGYLPMYEFRFSLPVKQSYLSKERSLPLAEMRVYEEVMERIQREGPLMVGDFENDRQEASTGWWDWRPAKVALERLYFEGRLMIARTEKFHKVYDVPMNLVPSDTDQTMPTPEAYARYVIRRTLGALGISSVKELAWRARRVKDNLVKQELSRMMAEGIIKTVLVQDVKTKPLYMLTDQETDVKLSGDAFILSPFDILNVFRHRLKDFFDFDYQVECFVPASKRKYGYFSLPVLLKDIFIARMDAKADRKSNTLLVHNLHFEPVDLNEAMLKKFTAELKAFMTFNGCRQIIFGKCNSKSYLKFIQKTLGESGRSHRQRE